MTISTSIGSRSWSIVLGKPAAGVVSEEIERLGRRRIFMITTASLARGSLLNGLKDALGSRLVGSFAGVTAHGPRQAVLDGARAVRAADADILLAVGGGSVIDATKVMQLCLRHKLDRADQLSDHVARGRAEPSTRPSDADDWIRAIGADDAFCRGVYVVRGAYGSGATREGILYQRQDDALKSSSWIRP